MTGEMEMEYFPAGVPTETYHKKKARTECVRILRTFSFHQNEAQADFLPPPPCKTHNFCMSGMIVYEAWESVTALAARVSTRRSCGGGLIPSCKFLQKTFSFPAWFPSSNTFPHKTWIHSHHNLQPSTVDGIVQLLKKSAEILKNWNGLGLVLSRTHEFRKEKLSPQGRTWRKGEKNPTFSKEKLAWSSKFVERLKPFLRIFSSPGSFPLRSSSP